MRRRHVARAVTPLLIITPPRRCRHNSAYAADFRLRLFFFDDFLRC